ncbi:MAG: hypothetical protein ACWA42_05795 [Lutibacter sp.]
MKNLLYFILFVSFLGVNNGFAQVNSADNQKKTDEVIELTETQINLINNQRDLIKKNRAKFKASLSKEQLAILNNSQLTKLERQKALIASFTQMQQNLLKQQRLSIDALKLQFRNSLTDSQLQQIRMRLRLTKNRKDFRQLIDRLMDRRIRRRQ